MSQNWNRPFRKIAAASLVAAMFLALPLTEQAPWRLAAQDRLVVRPSAERSEKSPSSFLSPDQWRQLDKAVDQGLGFITKSQNEDGSFPTQMQAQPGVTALCVMALLARGHQPGKGRYGDQIERAIDYVLDMQDPNSGAIMPRGSLEMQNLAAHYSHGIAGVMLAEVYGMTGTKQHDRIREAVVKALGYTRRAQVRPKGNPSERGGWRYVHRRPMDSDLSVTSWQLMFLRAARNADFNVPREWVDEAMAFVHRSFDANERAFVYGLADKRYATRGMVGAGIVCLELGGEHRSETGKTAGDWILRSSFQRYNQTQFSEDRYHYGAFYCTQAMFQLGGEYWQRFFPPLLKALAKAQHLDGSWDPESGDDDAIWGNVYTTSLAVLALATPYQILPIYQR
jgi:hypothetical protein